MQKLFAPFSLVSGLLAGVVAARLFEFVWSRFADDEAPKPDQRQVTLGPLLAGMLLEGAIARLTRGLVDRGARVAFTRLTGSWPGEEAPQTK